MPGMRASCATGWIATCGGNTTAFPLVRMPTSEQEQRRAVGRQPGALVRERQRCVVRGHGLMLAQGVRAPEGWWQPQIQVWQQHAQRLEEEVEAWTDQVVMQMGDQPIPKGVGALTSALLQGEILDWHRFKNRRQLGGYTGLCPSEHSSGDNPRQGRITKHGNPRIRHLLIEAVWGCGNGSRRTRP